MSTNNENKANCGYSCMNCAHIVDDCEYGDYGSTTSIHFLCNERQDVVEIEEFPFESVEGNCDKFLLSFWDTEFADLVDGSSESFDYAFDLYSKAYGIIGSEA